MGGVVVLEIGIVLDARYGGSLGEKPVWILMAVLFAIGAWMSLNSARDLISGPVVLRGWGAEQAQAMYETCSPNADVLVTVLLHTERVLDVACK